MARARKTSCASFLPFSLEGKGEVESEESTKSEKNFSLCFQEETRGNKKFIFLQKSLSVSRSFRTRSLLDSRLQGVVLLVVAGRTKAKLRERDRAASSEKAKKRVGRLFRFLHRKKTTTPPPRKKSNSIFSWALRCRTATNATAAA